MRLSAWIVTAALFAAACQPSHDWNGEVVEPAAPASPHQAQIGEIRKAGVKAASLIRQLLTFGHGKAMDVESVQLNDVVEEMRALVTQLIGGDVDLRLVRRCSTPSEL